MHKGKIRYYREKGRDGHGYIACPDFGYTLYFTKSDIHHLSHFRLKWGDEVTFGVMPHPHRKKRMKARSVKFIGFTPPTLETLGINQIDKDELIVGRLMSWDGMKGMIKSSKLQRMDTFLYYSRAVNAEVKINQLLVFKPVASKDPRSTYFAYFAYPIELEQANNLIHIYERDGKNDYPELEPYIMANYHREWLMQNLKWAASDNWTSAKKFWEEFELKHHKLDTQTIEQFPNTFQIYAWEQHLTPYINPNLLLEYFQKSNREQKEFILQQLTDLQRHEVLEKYIHWFLENKRYLMVHSDLKPFISLLKEYDKGRLDEINSTLVANLNETELLRLWLSDYMDTIPDAYALEYMLEHSNVREMKTFLEGFDKNKFNKSIYDSMERSLVSGLKPSLKTERIICISFYLNHYYQKNTKNYVTDLLPIIKKTLTSEQLLILMAFQVHLDLDIKTLLSNTDLNLVYLIKLDLLEKINLKLLLSDKNLEPGDVRNLFIDHFLKFPWGEQTGLDLADFLRSDYQKWYDRHVDSNHPAPAEIAVELFHLLKPAFSLQHLRLCLSFPEELGKEMDYYQFRYAFNDLTSAEKKRMRNALIDKNEKENEEREKEFVQPCLDFKKTGEDAFEYHASIVNLYFQNGKCCLRLETGEFSEYFENEWVSDGFNRISANSKEGNISLLILLENNKIKEIQGLDEVVGSIFKLRLSAILATTISAVTPNEGEISYAPDYYLKKAVLQYLEEQQIKNEFPLLIYEYDNQEGRHKNEESLSKFVKEKKLSKLFTIQCRDHLAIVWENIDFEGKAAATFVFKTTPERYQEQISRIKTAVSSYGNLRSYLKYTFKDDPERQFKLDKQSEWHLYLGYVGNLLKPRGEKNAFAFWKEKLESILSTPCPDIVSAGIPDIFFTERDYGLIIRRGSIDKKGAASRDENVIKVDSSVIASATGSPSPEDERAPDTEQREIENLHNAPTHPVLPTILQTLQSLHHQFLNNLK